MVNRFLKAGKFIKIETPAYFFFLFCEFCKISKNTFSKTPTNNSCKHKDFVTTLLQRGAIRYINVTSLLEMKVWPTSIGGIVTMF